MTDAPMPARVELVTSQDGRQLERALLVRTDCYEIAGTVFAALEIDELEDVTGG